MVAQFVAGLSAELPGEAAAKLGLAARLQVMRLRVEAPGSGPDAIHQLRVAARRCAAALAAFRNCLKRKDAEQAKALFRTVRRGAGEVRDWDVLLGMLRREALPCEFLLGYASGRREGARTRFAEMLDESRRRLIKICLRLPNRVRRPAAESIRRFRDLAAPFKVRIRSFDRSLRDAPRTAKELHRLRIEAKRVRYGLELFAPCIDPAVLEQVYPRVESLQDQLGAVQDDAMAVQRLEEALPLLADAWPQARSAIEERIAELRSRVTAAQIRLEEWRADWLSGGARLKGVLGPSM
ncbi:MAG: CHAD domain-containing protein [Gemmataceae bacterium]